MDTSMNASNKVKLLRVIRMRERKAATRTAGVQFKHNLRVLVTLLYCTYAEHNGEVAWGGCGCASKTIMTAAAIFKMSLLLFHVFC